MNPFYHCKIYQLSIEAGDQRQSHIPSFSLGTSSTSTSPCPPFLFDGKRDHGAFAGALPHHQGQLHEEIQGSTWSNYVTNKSSYQNVPGGDNQQEPVKWMSSKVRIMRKMIKSYQTPTLKPKRSKDQHLDKKKDNLESIIRVCSDCSTTKTPLWRTGPCGPKSLCNACGIRQRKARRAMASSSSSSSVSKDRVSHAADRTVPFKKRCRFTATAASVETAHRKLCYEDIVINLNKSTAFHRVFPQDEKDAAILLMALSSGLI